jgi:hypothetical protein
MALAFEFKWLAGYGVRPLRVLASIAALYILAAAIFKSAFDLHDVAPAGCRCALHLRR